MKMNLRYASTLLCRLEDWHELEKNEKFIKHITVMDSQSENEYKHFHNFFFIFRHDVFFFREMTTLNGLKCSFFSTRNNISQLI